VYEFISHNKCRTNKNEKMQVRGNTNSKMLILLSEQCTQKIKQKTTKLSLCIMIFLPK